MSKLEKVSMGLADLIIELVEERVADLTQDVARLSLANDARYAETTRIEKSLHELIDHVDGEVDMRLQELEWFRENILSERAEQQLREKRHTIPTYHALYEALKNLTIETRLYALGASARQCNIWYAANELVTQLNAAQANGLDINSLKTE